MDNFFGLKVINKSNIGDFSVPGVWALFGRRNDVIDDRWYCLQVAETNCVKSEVEKDMNLIDSELDEGRKEFEYVNQFGEFLFSYPAYPSAREYLYSKYMKKQFKEFQFVFICEERDRTIRRNIEKEFAYRANAVYWRNGRPYKSREEIDFKNRKGVTEEIPDNGDISKSVIIPFIGKLNISGSDH